MTSVERENGFHKISVGEWMGTMGSQWGEEYPGSMRSMERGNELYKIRGRENGLHEINGGEICGTILYSIYTKPV